MTFFVYPAVFFGTGGTTAADDGASGFYVFTLFFGAVFFAVPLLFKSGLIAPISFGFVVTALDPFLPDWLTFLLASVASTFLCCYLGFRINIDIFPPDIWWNSTPISLAQSIGATAVVCAALVGLAIWPIYRTNRTPKVGAGEND